MDRNSIVHLRVLEQRTVALRKESVDRNGSTTTMACKADVALRKESVDRNKTQTHKVGDVLKSLSARRAWIEIFPSSLGSALRKSLSARRAWIEIFLACRHPAIMLCRSPQGERG